MKHIYTVLALLTVFTAAAQIDRSKMPEPGPPPEIQLQEPQTFELQNGLKVMVVENHKLPRVSMTLMIDNPPILEGEKAGVSSLTGQLLGNGSTSISKDDFNDEVDFLGAGINFSAQGASANSLSKYFPRILELMADAAINPNFNQEDFETEKARLVTSIKNDESDVPATARRVQSALAFGMDHPYGEFLTKSTVENVSLDDVKKFYSDYFVPANAYLVVIGDVEFEAAKELIITAFTPWIKASPLAFGYTEPQDVQFTQINFVDMPNAVQSEIRAVNLVDLKMNSPDYLAARLANRIFGGGAQGRLQKNIREDKGFAYYAGSGLGDNKYANATFRSVTSVRNAVTDSAVVEILRELDSITTQPISPEELKNVKAEYTGAFVMALEQPETVARYALNIVTENLPADFYSAYLERLDAITVEDVEAAARKYFKAGNTRIVVVGKGSEILEGLEKIRFRDKRVPVYHYDLYAAKTDKVDYSAAIPDGVSVASIVGNYFKAIGGKDKIEQIKSIRLVYEGNAMGSTIKTEEKRSPGKFAQTTYMNDAPMIAVVGKGEEFYMKQSGNKMPLPPEMQNDLAYALTVFPEFGLVSNEKAKLSGIELIDEKEAYRIDVPGEIVQMSYFFEIATGLKLKEQSTITMNGQTQNQEINFKDYKEYDGILLPAVRVGNLGNEILESSLLEAQLNVEFTEADFE